MVRLIAEGKLLPQLHVVLLGGIAFGGFNVVDVEALAAHLVVTGQQPRCAPARAGSGRDHRPGGSSAVLIVLAIFLPRRRRSTRLAAP